MISFTSQLSLFSSSKLVSFCITVDEPSDCIVITPVSSSLALNINIKSSNSLTNFKTQYSEPFSTNSLIAIISFSSGP